MHYKRVGGIRFISAGRLSASISIRKPAPKPAPAPASTLARVVFWTVAAPAAFAIGYGTAAAFAAGVN